MLELGVLGSKKRRLRIIELDFHQHLLDVSRQTIDRHPSWFRSQFRRGGVRRWNHNNCR